MFGLFVDTCVYCNASFALALFISWDGMGRDGIEIGVKVKGKWLKEKSTHIITKICYVRFAALRAVGVWAKGDWLLAVI